MQAKTGDRLPQRLRAASTWCRHCRVPHCRVPTALACDNVIDICRPIALFGNGTAKALRQVGNGRFITFPVSPHESILDPGTFRLFLKSLDRFDKSITFNCWGMWSCQSCSIWSFIPKRNWRSVGHRRIESPFRISYYKSMEVKA